MIKKINFASIDQLHIITLFPIILFKVQNSLIYYYQANCLTKKLSSFKTLPNIGIRLLTQSLNRKTTLEVENYERLEFLGDSVMKFLASLEMYVAYPDSNRDLLFSKKRNIENNKSLYEKAMENEMQYLFSTPITIKRVSIPGFTTDDALIFDIFYYRSFSKNAFVAKGKKKIRTRMQFTILINGI